MQHLYLDIDRAEQAKILRELKQKTGLSWRKLAKVLGCSRSILMLYQNGKHRMSYNCLAKLCGLAAVDVASYLLKLVEINNEPKCEKIDLSSVNIEPELLSTLTPEDLQKVVAAGIITDGNLYYRKFDNKYLLKFYSTDKNLHAFFQKATFIAFNETPSGFVKDKRKNLWTTVYQRGTKNPMIIKLLGFSESYCSKRESKPSLDFLVNERPELKEQALRFAMSCDGSVSIKNSKNGDKSYALRLACVHPALVLQWKQIFQDIGINMRLDRDKNTWSGIHGLATGKKESFKRFAEIGGFLPKNVKVTNGKFVGLEKNEVLGKILRGN